MRPEELGDEYDEQLKKKKLEIEADMEQYIKVSRLVMAFRDNIDTRPLMERSSVWGGIRDRTGFFQGAGKWPKYGSEFIFSP